MADDVDLGRLRFGELLAGSSAAGLLVVLFAVDWFRFSGVGATGWDALEIQRFLMLALIALAFMLISLTIFARPVAMPVAAAVVMTGTAILTVLALLYRVGINEPGTNDLIEVEIGAYLGLALATAIAVGGWRSMQDERTRSQTSQRQAERVLAVRGAPRPAPPERDPDRPGSDSGEE